MAKLKLYYDLMSQPCRALYVFFKCASISFEDVVVSIQKGDQMKPDFVALNPFRKVPVLVHEEDGREPLVLRESCAMARYVTQNFLPSSTHWFPQNVAHSRIDEFLHWQHTNVRLQASMVFLNAVALPVMSRQPPDFKKIQRFKTETEKVADVFQAHFLDNRRFIGGDEVSIADLYAACELMQPTAAGFDFVAAQPRLKTWLDDVKAATQPHFDDAHAQLYHVRDMIAEGVQEAYVEFLEEQNEAGIEAGS